MARHAIRYHIIMVSINLQIRYIIIFEQYMTTYYTEGKDESTQRANGLVKAKLQILKCNLCKFKLNKHIYLLRAICRWVNRGH